MKRKSRRKVARWVRGEVERRSTGGRSKESRGKEGREKERETERVKEGERGRGRVPTHCSRHYANLRARMYAR